MRKKYGKIAYALMVFGFIGIGLSNSEKSTSSTPKELPEGATCKVVKELPACFESAHLSEVLELAQAGNTVRYYQYFPSRCVLTTPGDEATVIRSSAAWDYQAKVRLNRKTLWVYIDTLDCNKE